MPEILHRIDEPTRWDNPVLLLIVRGWCFARGGPEIVGIIAKTADRTWRGLHGLSRPDVAKAFGDARGAATSGFVVYVPRPAANSGEVSFEAVSADGGHHVLTVVNLT